MTELAARARPGVFESAGAPDVLRFVRGEL